MLKYYNCDTDDDVVRILQSHTRGKTGRWPRSYLPWDTTKNDEQVNVEVGGKRGQRHLTNQIHLGKDLVVYRLVCPDERNAKDLPTAKVTKYKFRFLCLFLLFSYLV